MDLDSLSARIAELEHQLAAVNQELEAVLYSISHDLRAPLMTIGGFTDLLLEHAGGLDETRIRYLHRIREGNTRLTKLLDGLLRLSRIGREPLDPHRVDLSTLAQASFTKMQQADPNRAVVFDATAPMPTVGDPTLISVLMDVLIENAWKFTSITSDARITVGRTPDGIAFVRDNGAGFDDRYHPNRLFKPLQRLHTEKQFPGIGIGLAIAAKIVHRHGGRIWAESKPGQGATVYFQLGEEKASGEEGARG